MMLRSIILALGIGCAGSNQQQEGDAQPYDYGELRQPFPAPKAEPVVPPPAPPEEAPKPKPKPDPCPGLCEALADANSDCGSWAASCQRLYQSLGNMNNDTCREKELACKKADSAQRAASSCKCGG